MNVDILLKDGFKKHDYHPIRFIRCMTNKNVSVALVKIRIYHQFGEHNVFKLLVLIDEVLYSKLLFSVRGDGTCEDLYYADAFCCDKLRVMRSKYVLSFRDNVAGEGRNIFINVDQTYIKELFPNLPIF